MLWNDLYDYWKSKHVDGQPPARQDIDPVVEIPQLVPYLLLIDSTPEGFRYRLLGSALTQRSGLEATGRLLGSTGMGERIAGPWRTAVVAVFDDQRPKLLQLRVAPQTNAEVQIIFLPLVRPSGETEMLLIGAFSDIVLQPPFEIEELKIVELDPQ